MKSPITGKEMTIISQEQEIKIKGRKVKYEHYYHYCEDSGHKFTDTTMDEINLENAYENLEMRKDNEKAFAIIGTALIIIILAWELMKCSTDWI